MIQIFHNNRCTKSRECLAFIEKSGRKFEIIKYLENIPTIEELESVINKLKIKPIELVRQKEKIWVEQFKGKILTDNEIKQAMILNPILIERPIVINGERAIIGRPVEKVAKII